MLGVESHRSDPKRNDTNTSEPFARWPHRQYTDNRASAVSGRRFVSPDDVSTGHAGHDMTLTSEASSVVEALIVMLEISGVKLPLFRCIAFIWIGQRDPPYKHTLHTNTHTSTT